jgi:hypothetical protein
MTSKIQYNDSLITELDCSKRKQQIADIPYRNNIRKKTLRNSYSLGGLYLFKYSIKSKNIFWLSYVRISRFLYGISKYPELPLILIFISLSDIIIFIIFS